MLGCQTCGRLLRPGCDTAIVCGSTIRITMSYTWIMALGSFKFSCKAQYMAMQNVKLPWKLPKQASALSVQISDLGRQHLET